MERRTRGASQVLSRRGRTRPCRKAGRRAQKWGTFIRDNRAQARRPLPHPPRALLLPAKRIYPPNDAYALSAKTEDQKFFRLPIAEDVAYRIVDGDIDALAPLLPHELLARFLELTDASPVRTATMVMCRRYAVEDDQDRLTLDTNVRTPVGKRMDFNVLEFKSVKPKPMPMALANLMLSTLAWRLDFRGYLPCSTLLALRSGPRTLRQAPAAGRAASLVTG